LQPVLAGFLRNDAFAANILIQAVFLGVRLVLETARPQMIQLGDISDP
jgi:hypothetical protein